MFQWSVLSQQWSVSSHNSAVRRAYDQNLNLSALTGNVEASPQQVADLQSIVSALLETINDKNLALHHLRNTNK